MSLLVEKDGSLKSDAIAFIFLGGWTLKKGLVSHDPFLLGVAVIVLLIALGKAMGKRWAEWLALLMYLGSVVYLARMWAITPSSLKWAVFLLIAIWAAWTTWRKLRSSSVENDGENSKPIISLVLLLSQPRYLEDEVLAHIIESAWGGDYTNEDEQKRDGFVVGRDKIYVVKSPMGIFTINNFSSSYWQDVQTVVNPLPDLRLRKIVSEHKAWLSVDLISSFENDPTNAAAYAAIVRLINELADDSVLGILRPETNRINEWNGDVQEELLRPRGEERFHKAGNAPVIPVAADDPEMIAAVEEARRRWPEFVAAYQKREADDTFSIKAAITVGEVTEHIWVQVNGIEPEYVHGKLGNEPVDLAGLKLGSRVEVPVADVEDWGCQIGDGKLQGLFTPAVVHKRQQQFAPR